jgi:hypothetical protein
MPTVEFTDDKKYGKAIGLLLELGGIFRTKPERQLMVGPGQLQFLQAAGLVPKTNGAGNTKPVRDYHTIVIVYANPIDPSDRFFQELKAILKRASLVEQDESSSSGRRCFSSDEKASSRQRPPQPSPPLWGKRTSPC